MLHGPDFYSYKEQKTHGSQMFPLEVYRIILHDCILKHHWHDEVEFIIVEDGEAIFQINSSFYHLIPGQVLVVNSGSIHSSQAANNKPCSLSAIVFKIGILNSREEDIFQVRYINSLVNNTNRFIEFLDCKDEWSANIAANMKMIIDAYFRQEKGYELYIKSLLFQIIYIFILNNKLIQMDKKENRINEDIKEILNFIWDNYNKEIGLSDMANVANFSKYYFCHFFKSQIGKSPIEYLNYYRIEKATELMLKTKKRISEIASDVGYDNVGYFIKIFKRYKKCTPTEFRKSYLDI